MLARMICPDCDETLDPLDAQDLAIPLTSARWRCPMCGTAWHRDPTLLTEGN
jgi:transposase